MSGVRSLGESGYRRTIATRGTSLRYAFGHSVRHAACGVESSVAGL
jgi:hypothetical protein